MSLDLEERLNEKYSEYVLFKRGGSQYRAVQLLGEIYNCVPKLDKKKQVKWLKCVRKERLDKHSFQEIIAKLERDIREIKRLLSIFDVWIVEEIVFIMTLKIQVDLVIAVFEEVGYEEINISLTNIDKKISQISRGETSKRPFAESIKLIRKNWGMPISNKWLNNSANDNKIN